MPSSAIFTNNRSQAVRIPKSLAFPDDVREVEVLKVGSARLLVPKGRRWDDFFNNGPWASDDFMQDREQPPIEEREPF